MLVIVESRTERFVSLEQCRWREKESAQDDGKRDASVSHARSVDLVVRGDCLDRRAKSCKGALDLGSVPLVTKRVQLPG